MVILMEQRRSGAQSPKMEALINEMIDVFCDAIYPEEEYEEEYYEPAYDGEDKEIKMRSHVMRGNMRKGMRRRMRSHMRQFNNRYDY